MRLLFFQSAYYSLIHRLEVSALKRAIRNISDTNEEEKIVSGDIFEKLSLKGLTKEQEITMKLKMRQTMSHIAGIMTSKSNRKDKKILTNGEKLLQLSEKVSTLSELAEEALTATWKFEEQNRQLTGELQDAHAEKEILVQKSQDLEAAATSNGKYKQQLLASRLVSLSEDVRSNKLVTLQQRRQINVLRQEKKHLQVNYSNFTFIFIVFLFLLLNEFNFRVYWLLWRPMSKI